MFFWRGRSRVALASVLGATGIGLVAFLAPNVPVVAADHGVRTDDPRDVGAVVDLKAHTHMVDGSAIVYTAETYAPFSDEITSFKWGIDRDGDEGFDLILSTDWRDGTLTGVIRDAAGAPVAPAVVSRPGPATLRVTFPVGVLGGVAVYRYAVGVEADRDGDGPDDPGERDLVPNSGLIEHRLAAVAPAGVGEAGNPGTPPARAEAAAPPRTAAEAPAAAPASTPEAAASPAGGETATTAAGQGASGDLPRTGPGDRTLVSWSGLALTAGGALVALGARRRRMPRVEVEDRRGNR